MTQIFLLTTSSGSTGVGAVMSFPDPGNWNPTHKVECIGAGCRSSAGTGGGAPNAGAGGGGGAYAVGSNLNLTFPVPYTVVPEQNYQGNGSTSYCTQFNSSQLGGPPAQGSNVYASMGCNTSGAAWQAGQGGTAFYPAGFRGGDGGSCPAGGA